MKTDKDKTVNRRMLQAEPDFPRLVVQSPYGEEIFEIDRQDYYLDSMADTKVEIKIKFQKPGEISMSSQTELDSLVIKWPQGLVLSDEDGNGLILDGALEDKDGSSLDNNIVLQQQVDPESEETQTLDSTG